MMISRLLKNALPVLLVALALTACGGGGGGGGGGSNNGGDNGGDNGGQTPPANAPSVTLNFGMKQLQFSWDAVNGATHYSLFEDVDGASGYVHVGSYTASTASTYNVTHDINLATRINARYIVQACNVGGCKDSAPVIPGAQIAKAIGYFKASNTGADDDLGFSVSLSADGTTLAVGAIGESGSADAVSRSGAVYIFARSDSGWSQQAYLKASNAGADDWFGTFLSLSADGNTLAVGAPNEDSNATGVNPSGDTAQSNNEAPDSGAVYVFTRSGSTWTQQAYVKASNTDAGDWFGYSLSLSGDGNTLAVGAQFEDSKATGINPVDGAQDDTADGSGAIYIFTRSNSSWSQQAYVKASNTAASDYFGRSLSLSGDGNMLAVGAPYEDSNATGIPTADAQQNNEAPDSGAAYVFTRSGSTWTQQAYVKASNTGAFDWFGNSLSLSGDGNTLAVGATGEGSNATGINPSGDAQSNNGAAGSGAVYIFARSDSGWTQQAYVKASNTEETDVFGISLSLSGDGNMLAVGAYGEDSNATGINPPGQSDNTAGSSGAAYVVSRSGSGWTQKAYVKASNTGAGDLFGLSLSLSADGNTLAVGAKGEDNGATGIATGIDGDHSNNSSPGSGAVYLY